MHADCHSRNGSGRAALGKAFSEAGHEVVIGTRDPEQTKQRAEWAGLDLPLAAYQDLDADVFINATDGEGSLAALRVVGGALNSKVVIDTSNALDFSHGFPPSLFVSNTDSLAEQLQRALPEARLVKMFNTMNNQVMGNPHGLAETRRSLSPATMSPRGKLRHHSLPISVDRRV